MTLAFGGVKALTGVGFRVAPGSFTAVIGPNGAGKTSLFNTICGFFKPVAGQIRLEGRDITRVPAPERAKLGLARSFQNMALFGGMTVLDNIKLGRHAHLRTHVLDALFYLGRARREEMALRADIKERIIDFLEIDHIRHAPVSALSYGLQKRVELARALAMNPKVLMLDEPVADMNREETDDIGTLHPGRPVRMGRDGADGRARHGYGQGLVGPRGGAELRASDRGRHRARCRRILKSSRPIWGQAMWATCAAA